MLTNFLGELGAPESIIWVTREQLASNRRRVWLHPGDPIKSSCIAESIYRVGQSRGLGASLRAVCSVGDSTACYVWVPRDETDASYAMQPPSLKCWVPKPLVAAVRIDSALHWRLLRLINGFRRYSNTYVCEVPGGLEGAP